MSYEILWLKKIQFQIAILYKVIFFITCNFHLQCASILLFSDLRRIKLSLFFLQKIA